MYRSTQNVYHFRYIYNIINICNLSRYCYPRETIWHILLIMRFIQYCYGTCRGNESPVISMSTFNGSTLRIDLFTIKVLTITFKSNSIAQLFHNLPETVPVDVPFLCEIWPELVWTHDTVHSNWLRNTTQLFYYSELLQDSPLLQIPCLTTCDL